MVIQNRKRRRVCGTSHNGQLRHVFLTKRGYNTLDQEEILLLLSENREETFQKLLETSLNRILQAESTAQLGAERYERTDERTDSRNGTRQRPLVTRIGRVELQVPRRRNQPFNTLLFDNYSRSEAALIASMAEMVVNGVSTRKVGSVMETLCGTSYSKSTVSEVCKDLEKEVKAFRERPLTEEYPFLMIDATYFKVRENHRITSKALMIALGTTREGKREILGFGTYSTETAVTWEDFFSSLKRRGLHGLYLITSDAHEGLRLAMDKAFPDVCWQRCQTHFSRNIMDHAPKQHQAAIHDEVLLMYQCKTIEEARRKRDAIIAEYSRVAEKAMKCLDEGFESAMSVLTLPESMRRFFRTSNHLERLNKELKRRSNVIGVFPNEASLLRLMGSVLLEQNELCSSHSKVHFKTEDAKKLDLIKEDLRSLALEQHKLLTAA